MTTADRTEKTDKETTDKQKALDMAMSHIDRQFGKGSIMRLGEKAASMERDAISTGSLSLDLALGVGGIPRGRVVEVFGAEASGKTTMLNAISTFIPPIHKIVSIEDTPELQVPHPTKVLFRFW